MSKRSSGEGSSFVGGIILGLIVGAPIAAWLSPRSGRETRLKIRQGGTQIAAKAGEIARTPVELAEQVQEKVGQLQDKVKGESIDDALAEGKSIAAERATHQN